ncbi:hypothetical protein CJ030_MR4G020944 [Morella rubra]|uniref:Uncharacterized protein n=1 Tax=Morella rubra TaxID=262757 RepID=A0A6A1VZS7_9ROSI|nr:hypothetical protein CJ030_MR4G020944 [Morella rubra]
MRCRYFCPNFLHWQRMSHNVVVSQHMARHSPLRFDDLLASIGSSIDQEDKPSEVEMVG